jgi:demethylmenaquinone methyltransferase / 2-methoxy-6-polyprenyl-1,4-benzoquinol methylase
MCDRVAAGYDMANDALSLGADRAWRKLVVEGGVLVVCEFSTGPGDRSAFCTTTTWARPAASVVQPCGVRLSCRIHQPLAGSSRSGGILETAGRQQAKWRNLSGGIVALHRARA